jgi:hypothetical protein
MTFADVAGFPLDKQPQREEDPEFIRLIHMVARGEMTADEAWKILQESREKEQTASMCPHCGELFVQLDNGLIPSHFDSAFEVHGICAGTGQGPRNPESDRRPLWNGKPNPHLENPNGTR